MHPRKKNREPAYNSKTFDKPKQTKQNTIAKKNSDNILHARMERSEWVKDDLHHTKKLKTSVLIDNKNRLKVWEENKENIINNFQNIPSYRPIKEITDYSASGSPNKVVTPGKTELFRVTQIGDHHFFTNNSELTSLTQTRSNQTNNNIKDEFFKSAAYESLKKTFDSLKYQQIKVTADLLKATRKENAKNFNRRHITQQQAAAEENTDPKNASADKYANAALAYSGTFKWEWLHLVAHMILGAHSQNIKNFICGSEHANTEMLIAESEVKYLASVYPEGFNLEVKSQVMQGKTGYTHVGTEIEYIIKTKDFTFPFTFNVQNPNKPHIAFKKYIHESMKILVEAYQNKTTVADNIEKKTKNENEDCLLFFNKTCSPSTTERIPPAKKKLNF
ncbi:MAG: hypothetical protein A3F11_03985 [Gammaproteobacteria bacterium RIFCSPHIGHO2_12_FULL_37_14]|nr:MAG: hypothetical protein A3F11_03985 [Gammaproteobacteria bacterium RIFCSPHIGHO2_12_FULL_37_14]